MRAAWILAGVALLAPTFASAETLEVDRFEPVREMELLGLQGIDVDTGWQPPSSNIQVRFITHADDNILIEMPGDAVFDWDTGEVHFVGDEDAGVFDVDIGVLLDARFRFDLLGQDFESSFIGPYDLGIFQEASYTPYLLPGNDDRPLLVDDETTPIEVFNYAIVDAIIASGSFFVDASFDIDMELTCERIDITDADGVEAGSILAEFEALGAADRDAEVVELLASLHCTLLSDIELILYPGVELEIAFQEFQLVPFELRIPLLDDRTDAVDFEPLPIVFDMPPVDTPGESTGEGSSGGDESGADAQSGTSDSDGDSDGGGGSMGPMASEGTDSGGSGGSSDTDSAGGMADSSEGCGCTTGQPGRVGTALFLFLLFSLRRRRTSLAHARAS
ncbi:MAG: hypothetical protein KUG77_16790 [Nannocystaceae bacterium]|nr:hypothetical protein [Nannocystaceae bacterium]